jgi:hypothetical protein
MPPPSCGAGEFAAARNRRRRNIRAASAVFSEHIGQADQVCDFDFLQGKVKMPEPEIHRMRVLVSLPCPLSPDSDMKADVV